MLSCANSIIKFYFLLNSAPFSIRHYKTKNLNIINSKALGMAGENYDVCGIFLNESDMPGAKSVKEPLECSVEELKAWL